jgi:DNA repair protein RecO
MEEKKTEGLLLHSIPYLRDTRILKVLTKDHGLISLIAKKKSLTPFTHPFLIAEWVYQLGRGNIHILKEASLQNDLSNLRESFSVISSAGAIAQDLLKSQFPEKQGSGPYALTTAFFQKLPYTPKPHILVASFRMKLLIHDGLLSLENGCSECGNQALFLDRGESFCQNHTTSSGIGFSITEWTHLQELTFLRQFGELQRMEVEQITLTKIQEIFYRCTERDSNP